MLKNTILHKRDLKEGIISLRIDEVYKTYQSGIAARR